MPLLQPEQWNTRHTNTPHQDKISCSLEQQSAHPAQIHLRDPGDCVPAWSTKSRTEIEHKKQNSDQLLALQNPDCFGRSAEHLTAWRKGLGNQINFLLLAAADKDFKHWAGWREFKLTIQTLGHHHAVLMPVGEGIC